jgi:hypothetical protein
VFDELFHYALVFNPYTAKSILFNSEHRNAVLISNAGMITQGLLCYFAIRAWGFASFAKWYMIPWLEVNHWSVLPERSHTAGSRAVSLSRFTMITYLHHTDPCVPHYRSGTWNFQRGAAATVDRDFLGWQGRFFLHDVRFGYSSTNDFTLIYFGYLGRAFPCRSSLLPEHAVV